MWLRGSWKSSGALTGCVCTVWQASKKNVAAVAVIQRAFKNHLRRLRLVRAQEFERWKAFQVRVSFCGQPLEHALC